MSVVRPLLLSGLLICGLSLPAACWWAIEILVPLNDGRGQTGTPVPTYTSESGGLLRVCLTTGPSMSVPVRDEDMFDVLLPARSLFEHGGELVGDLRDLWDIKHFHAWTVHPHVWVVTLDDIRLTQDNPCAEVRSAMYGPGFMPGELSRWIAVAPGNLPGNHDVWDFHHVLPLMGEPAADHALSRAMVVRAQVSKDIREEMPEEAVSAALTPGQVIEPAAIRRPIPRWVPTGHARPGSRCAHAKSHPCT